MANIVDLEVMCGKRHMEVSVLFDKPFNGIIFSKVRIKKIEKHNITAHHMFFTNSVTKNLGLSLRLFC